MIDPSPTSIDRQWYIVGRWEEYGGEARANLIRIIAIGVFYTLQLAEHHLLSNPDQRDTAFHRSATALAAAGLFVAIAVQLCLHRKIFPALLKYLSTAADIVLVSALAVLGGGPQSPMRLVYFSIIAMAALRFSLPLVWMATIGTLLGYLSLVALADRTWFDAEHVVRPIEQLITLASLALTGIIVGQVIRRVRGMADDYRQRTLHSL